MKDPTRGGFANALNEMATKSGIGILIEEDLIPFKPALLAACEMLGLDPLEVANEGKAIIGVRPGFEEGFSQSSATSRTAKMQPLLGKSMKIIKEK